VAAEQPERFAEHIHLPPLADHSGVAVELHTTTSLGLTPAESWRRMNGGAREIQRHGNMTRVPRATELLWHAVTHAPLAWPHAFRLRFLQDAAVVLAAAREVDWAEISRRLRTDEIPDDSLAARWLAAAGWLAGRDCSAVRPEPVPPVDLSTLLQWRLEVFRYTRAGHQSGGLGDGTTGLAARGRRLLIDEGTLFEVGLARKSPRHVTGLLPQAGRQAASVAARLCYLGWRAVRR